MLASVDGERASQAAEAQREGELQSELQSEQRELDEVKFQLLREQARALELLMPQAEAAHSELLRYELESSVSQLSELQSRWGWDETGKAPVAATMDLLGGGAAAASVEESDDEDDSEEESSDEEAAAPAPPSALPFGFMATAPAPAPAPAMPPAAALPPPTQQPATAAAGEESSDEESEEEDNSHMADAPSWLTSAASEVLGDPKPPIAPPPAALPPPAPPQPAQEESSEEEEDSGDASPTPCRRHRSQYLLLRLRPHRSPQRPPRRLHLMSDSGGAELDQLKRRSWRIGCRWRSIMTTLMRRHGFRR